MIEPSPNCSRANVKLPPMLPDLQILSLPSSGVEFVVTPMANRADVGASMVVGRLSQAVEPAVSPKSPATANLAIAGYDLVVIRHLSGTRKSALPMGVRPGTRSGVLDTGVQGGEPKASPHSREPVGVKAEASRTMRPKAYVTECDGRGAGHGRRLARGGERQEHVPPRKDAWEDTSLTPRQVNRLRLATQASGQAIGLW